MSILNAAAATSFTLNKLEWLIPNTESTVYILKQYLFVEDSFHLAKF